jgi:hypothetical protein
VLLVLLLLLLLLMQDLSIVYQPDAVRSAADDINLEFDLRW